MSSMEHPGMEHPPFARSVPPEYALLLFGLAALVGIVLAWPWAW